MGNDTEKSASEKQTAPVDAALNVLKGDVTQTAEALKGLTQPNEFIQLADRLESELSGKRLNMTKEQLEKLTFDVNLQAMELKLQSVKKAVEDQKDTEEKYWTIKVSNLEQRYKALEQAAATPSYVPEWAKPMVESGKEMLNSAFENSKGVLAMVGGFFGKKWESSKDVLKSMKGFFFGALKGDIGKSIPFFGPQITRWAEREYFQESVLTGIRQAVKDKKISGLTITLDESSWNTTDSNALIKRLRLHDASPNADMQSVANDFARQFIEDQAKNLEKPKKVTITASELEKATFIKPFAVTPSTPLAPVASPPAAPASAPTGTPGAAQGVPASGNKPTGPL